MKDTSDERPRNDPNGSRDLVRDWLQVPDNLTVPTWAQQQLELGVRAEVEAHQGRPVDQVVFGIVDLETTGLSAERDRIIEIGLVVQRGARVLERWATFVEIEGPLPPIVSQLTGIQAHELHGAPSEEEAIERFAAVLGDSGVELLVAHNARFDHGFLERAWLRQACPLALPEFLCSLRAARAWIKAPRYGLGQLVEQLSIPPAPRHRALGDAEMTAALWHELLQRARVQGVHTLEALREKTSLSRRAGTRKRRVVLSAPEA